MPRKRAALSRLTSTARRLRNLRNSETSAERSERLNTESERVSQRREQETPEERSARLQFERERSSQRRNQENDDNQRARLDSQRERTSQQRHNETPEQQADRLAHERERSSQRRQEETPEQQTARLAYERERLSQLRQQETPQQQTARLANERERSSQRRQEETPDQQTARLAYERERLSQLRQQETPQQQTARLANERERSSQRRQEETPEQQTARLANERERSSQRRQEETFQQQQDRQRADRERQARVRIQRPVRLKFENKAFHYDKSQPAYHLEFLEVGNMDITCVFCGAKKFRHESNSLCCGKGKVVLQPLIDPPNSLKVLHENDECSRHFKAKIRPYNSAFQMTSFGADRIVSHQGYNPSFIVQGQVYHTIGPLLPGESETKFLQIYFMSEADQLSRRCSIWTDLHPNVIQQLQQMLHQVNPYVTSFRTVLEETPSVEYKLILHADRTPPSEHTGRFNLPSASEVAVIMANTVTGNRDIVLKVRGDANNSLMRISETNKSYDALQYPLLFPHGEDGYHFNLWHTNPSNNQRLRKKISAMEFYSHRLMIRDNSFNIILKCNDLSQQYIVDMYAKIETERLLYIRTHQKELRADQYIHLRDAINNDGNSSNTGQLVILTSSFTGSPRYMHEKSQDAMSYVRSFGRPSLFITATTNPSWPEITTNLFPGQTPQDRPDLIARVFHRKQQLLIKLLTTEKVFGDFRAFVAVIEWQKRGLPHTHILLWLREPIREHEIDNIISAEFPDPTDDPILFEIIGKHMVHGPCGHFNQKSPCMKDRKCTKRYPRSFCTETNTGGDGYPLYRRRGPEDGGFQRVMKLNRNDVTVDNRWVVPYNPLLSRMMNAHVNVECCMSVKSIKYVCKYVHKGTDQAVASLQRNNDEISLFQSARYISSNEACWRIFGFSVHERHPVVVHLQIHLENGQRVYYTEDNAISRAMEPPRTTLTEFFHLCQHDDFAQTLFYNQIPKFFVWNKSSKKWSRRKQGKPVVGYNGVKETDAIGRVYTIHPNQSECYYLRLLLHVVPGPTSFESLRAVDGNICATFREACRLRGLLDDDAHLDKALEEAMDCSTSERLRHLFSIILTACNPANSLALWEKYKTSLAEDIHYRQITTASQQNRPIPITDATFDECLGLIQDKVLDMGGRPLEFYGLPVPTGNLQHDRDYLRETVFDMQQVQQYVESRQPKLTSDQKTAYTRILEKIDNSSGSVFLDAPGGTGKTFLLNLILSKVRLDKKIALAVASSGVAATLLSRGRTAHSALKIPLDIRTSDTPICNVRKGTTAAKLLTEASVIVWDECTMAHKKSVEAVDRTMKDLRGNSNPFGGCVFIFAGDFRQTLPVIPRGTRADEYAACLKTSYLWHFIETVSLKTNMRVHLYNDSAAGNFAQVLLDIGNNKVNVDQDGSFTITSTLATSVETEDRLESLLFEEVNNQTNEWKCDRAILAPKNEVVNKINLKVQSRLSGAEKEYFSTDSVLDVDEAVNFPTEFLNSLIPSGMPPHKLVLKIGSVIMLIRNLDPPRLCNGTRLVITNLYSNVVEAVIMSKGSFRNEIVLIPRIPLIPSDVPIPFKRVQFPVQLAFAITINKSQGQTFTHAGLCLSTSCFSHGQFYVACSRVGSPTKLFIYAPENKTRNIVYPEALQ